MSLYYEAAALLTNAERVGGSLKSRVYGKKELKSAPAQVYALTTEATRWSAVLKDVIERAGVLKEERKLTPILALLLAYDLLLSKNGVAAPANHVLKVAITRHRARLQAELTRARLKLGLGSLEALRAYVQSANGTSFDTDGEGDQFRHPRWARINTMRASTAEDLSWLEDEYKPTKELRKVLEASTADQIYYTDHSIHNLLAFPPDHDLSALRAYKDGKLIIQDKASCFPAALLDPAATDGDIIDATAAPGNKTTHLAALLDQAQRDSHPKRRKVVAYEKNKARFQILQKMVGNACRGDEKNALVDVRHQDFLTVDPHSHDLRNVSAILLDPSCSGSGIIGRDDDSKLVLPEAHSKGAPSLASKKRKRHADLELKESAPATQDVEDEQTPIINVDDEIVLRARLEALAAFQLKILLHAMSFPNCRRITYSTCSVHHTENEDVVLKALEQSRQDGSGWRILKREEQILGLRNWPVRGDKEACTDDEEVVEACIRCHKGTAEGTMGFFVAGFVRDETGQATSNGHCQSAEEGDEDEWDGFED